MQFLEAENSDINFYSLTQREERRNLKKKQPQANKPVILLKLFVSYVTYEVWAIEKITLYKCKQLSKTKLKAWQWHTIPCMGKEMEPGKFFLLRNGHDPLALSVGAKTLNMLTHSTFLSCSRGQVQALKLKASVTVGKKEKPGGEAGVSRQQPRAVKNWFSTLTQAEEVPLQQELLWFKYGDHGIIKLENFGRWVNPKERDLRPGWLPSYICHDLPARRSALGQK